MRHLHARGLLGRSGCVSGYLRSSSARFRNERFMQVFGPRSNGEILRGENWSSFCAGEVLKAAGFDIFETISLTGPDTDVFSDVLIQVS